VPKRLTLILLLLTLSACASENEHLTRATALHPEGRAFFDQFNCDRCHEGGEGGMGRRMIENTNLRELAYIQDRVRNGKGPMPAYPQLTDEQLRDVALFVRALAGWEE
jgi:mono/diheme cytochrome c family protein